jgi:predicted MFS family arabinose efflux permease
MRSDLGWSFADAGALNTANAAGYMIGALVAAPVATGMGDKRVFAVSLWLTALAVGASGLTADYSVFLALRVAPGLTGALAFVSGAGLTSAAAAGGSKSREPTLLSLCFAGIGITASAVAVPPLLGELGWRGGWLVLGALALGATVFGWVALRRTPEPSYTSGSTARGGVVAAVYDMQASRLWSLWRRLHRPCDLHHRLPA